MSLLTELGSGTLFAGCAGLAQLTLLPGLLVQQVLKRRKPLAMPALDTLLFIFTSSGVLSFLLVLLLQQSGLHNHTSWLVLGVLQAALCLYLCLTRRPVADASPDLHWLSLSSALALLVFAGSFMALLLTVVGHWPGAFEGWDAVFSWNRWAKDWSRGAWPFLTWDYPQLVPANWSVLYLWLRSTEIEPFARVWMGLFPLALLLTFLALFLYWRHWTLLLAGAVMTPLLLGPYGYVLDSGYVDVALTFATLLTAHWVLMAQHDVARAERWLLYASTAAAMALLTKQSGLLALMLLLWGCWRLRAQDRVWLRPMIVLVVLTAPWYVLRWLHAADDSVLSYVTRDIYGGETLPARLARALTQTLPAVIGLGSNKALAAAIALIAATGIALSLRNRNGRFCAVIGVGTLLMWAALFSYDGRNLLPAIPLVLLAVAYGFGSLRLPALDNKMPILLPQLKALRCIAPYASVGLIMLVLMGSFLPASRDRWQLQTNELRKHTGLAALNQQLIAFVSTPGFDGKILTTYPPLAAISELRPYYFMDYGASHMQPLTAAALSAGRPLCDVLLTIAGSSTIQYLLLHKSAFPAVINKALADGSLQLELGADPRLMKVQCPLAAADSSSQ